MVELAGKNAIVTGASVGIGNAYARALAQEGVNVAVCDIRGDITDLPAALEKHQVKAVGWVADVSKPDDVRKVVDGAIAAFGSVDILINNAGQCVPSLAEDDLDKSLDDYDHMVGTNLKGEYLMGRAVIAHMLERGGGGEIVNIATDHGVTCGSPNEICPGLDTCPWKDSPRPTGGGEVMDIYDSSKWGINGLVFGWAKALKPHGIRVNAMAMGATDSHMIRGFFGYPPRGEPLTEEQEAEVATWMSPEASAQVVVDLLKEGPDGRTACMMNLCVGRPPVLEPALPHIYIVEEDLNVAS